MTGGAPVDDLDLVSDATPDDPTPVASFDSKGGDREKGEEPNQPSDAWDDCMQGCQNDYDQGCTSGCDCGDSSEQCQDDLEYTANNCEQDCGVDHL